MASLLGADECGQAILRSARFPVPSYTYPETAVRALAHALRYAAWRARPSGTVPVLPDVDVNEARRRLPHQEVDGADAGLAPGWVTRGRSHGRAGRFRHPGRPYRRGPQRR